MSELQLPTESTHRSKEKKMYLRAIKKKRQLKKKVTRTAGAVEKNKTDPSIHSHYSISVCAYKRFVSVLFFFSLCFLQAVAQVFSTALFISFFSLCLSHTSNGLSMESVSKHFSVGRFEFESIRIFLNTKHKNWPSLKLVGGCLKRANDE